MTTCFNDLRLLRFGFEHPTFRLRGQRFNLLRHRRGLPDQHYCIVLYINTPKSYMLQGETNFVFFCFYFVFAYKTYFKKFDFTHITLNMCPCEL